MTKDAKDPSLTCDAFLGGKLHLLQPREGYRAGVDPVLLAACVPAKSGQSVLELGCGVGAAILCLGTRVPGLSLTGVERHASYSELAQRNGAGQLDVVNADLNDLPASLRQQQFDHVLANPPYFDRRASVAAHDPSREAALGEETPLVDWIKIAAKRLAPKGLLHLIHRAERLPDLLMALPSGMGSIEVLPIAPRVERAAELVILRARKNGRAQFKLHAPCIMHEGKRHQADGDDYMPEIAAVLREGAALKFGAAV